MPQRRIRQNGKMKYVQELEFDPSPLYAVKVNADGTLDHSVAYDPMYTCECEKIEGRHPRRECGS